MAAQDIDQEKARQEQELKTLRHIAFASGIFKEDVTVRTLLESLPEGVVIIDNSGTILLVNARAEQMFGYPEKELIGKPNAILIPERFRDVHKEHMAHFFAEPKIRPMGLLLDLTGRRRDGSEFPLEISLSFIETINGILFMAFISDITIRKQYESHLQESEELFHIQVECVKGYAIYMLDIQGNVLNWNEGAERLNGFRTEEIIGKHFSCFYPEEERNAGKPEEELKKASAEGWTEEEGWRVRKDGNRFWADEIISALHDKNGNLRGFSKVTHDISERKRAEDALRFIEARYRALYRENPTMIVTLDADLTVLSANPFCASQLGYTTDELEGQSVLKLFHEDDRSAVVEQLQRCLQNPNQVHRWQFRKVRKDGGLLWVEEIAQAVYDLNGALNVLVVCQDVTERKRTEEALRKSEQKFSKIFQSVPALICITTLLEGTCIDINERGSRTLGFQREEMIGRTMLELGVWESKPVWDQMIRLLEEDGMVRDLEINFRGKNGKIFTGLFSAETLDFYGERYMLSMVNDITDRKRMEEEIVRLNTNLAAHSASLEAVNKEQEAFNYTVAHDLRQPLNVIGISCQVMQEMYGDQLQDECMRYIQVIYNSSLHMNRLIDALLNFSHIGHVEPCLEMVDLCKLAHEVAKILKQSEPERQVDFRIADGIVVNGDANLLRVVLNNLLGNAWKYTRMREEAVIEFGTTKIDGKPTYFVRDNGAGFDKAHVDKLFVPFQRLPGSDEECNGFGIGLATVERIIIRHGGRVWAEGEPGKGATFYFTLQA